MPIAGILAGKGANIGNLFCTAPKVLKLHGEYFGIYIKYWAKKAPEGGHMPSTRVEGAPYPTRGALRSCGPPGRPPTPFFCYKVCFDLEKSEGTFWDEAPPSRGGTWAELI